MLELPTPRAQWKGELARASETSASSVRGSLQESSHLHTAQSAGGDGLVTDPRLEQTWAVSVQRLRCARHGVLKTGLSRKTGGLVSGSTEEGVWAQFWSWGDLGLLRSRCPWNLRSDIGAWDTLELEAVQVEGHGQPQ